MSVSAHIGMNDCSQPAEVIRMWLGSDFLGVRCTITSSAKLFARKQIKKKGKKKPPIKKTAYAPGFWPVLQSLMANAYRIGYRAWLLRNLLTRGFVYRMQCNSTKLSWCRLTCGKQHACRQHAGQCPSGHVEYNMPCGVQHTTYTVAYNIQRMAHLG